MNIKEALKTPSNTDELKQIYKNNGLVYYTPKEELFNSISHALGAVVALVFMIFMLLKATTPAAYATAVLSCALIAIEFSVSATYHGVSDMKKKLTWRMLDFPAVNLNVIACATATCLMYGSIYGYVAFGVSFAIAAVIFALCLYRFDIFRKVSVASTFVIGGLMFGHSSQRISRKREYRKRRVSSILQDWRLACWVRRCSECTNATCIACSMFSCLSGRYCF